MSLARPTTLVEDGAVVLPLFSLLEHHYFALQCQQLAGDSVTFETSHDGLDFDALVTIAADETYQFRGVFRTLRISKTGPGTSAKVTIMKMPAGGDY